MAYRQARRLIHSVAYADSRDAVSGNAPSGERLQGKDRH